MSDGGANRPRRAISPFQDDADDTPTVELATPRRSWRTEDPEASDTEITPVPPPIAGRRFSSAALPEGFSGRARRSAASALSPAEPDDAQAAALARAFAQDQDEDKPGEDSAAANESRPIEGAATDSTRDEPHARPRRDRFTMAFSLVALLAALILIGGMVLSAMRPRTGPTPTAAPSPTSTSPALSADDLLTPTDLAGLGGATTWFVSQTLTELTATSPQVACLTAVTGTVKPSAALQRTLTTGPGNALAALNQLDKFDTQADATSVYGARVARLAACDDTPARIIGASAVTGIGDAATQVTVAYQGAQTIFHTTLIVRTGSLVGMFDVAQRDKAVGADALVKAAGAALSRACTGNGTCPGEVAVNPTPPPSSAPAGWLIESDWPRLSADTGRWTATAPGPVTFVGTGCENLTLASVSGPTARSQRTFLLTQDPKVPQTFGADELLFTFPDVGAASAFAKKLGDDLSSCGTRLLTATVANGTAVDGSAGEVKVTGRTFTIAQSPTADSKVVFQAAVVTAGPRVSYLMVNTTEQAKFDPAVFASIALRAGQRSTQSPK